MARLALVAAVLGVVATVGAAPPADDVERLWCFTYLSTYLEPLDRGSGSVVIRLCYDDRIGVNSRVHGFRDLCHVCRVRGHIIHAIHKRIYPGIFDTNRIHTDQRLKIIDGCWRHVLFKCILYDGRDLRSIWLFCHHDIVTCSYSFMNTCSTREDDPRGFISTGLDENPPTCDQASVFILSDAQELFIGGIPLYYDVGDSFRQLRSTSSPPAGAVTRGFTTANRLLVFQNPALPNGEASFCQDATSGQCQNGQIVSVSTGSGSILQTQTAISPSDSQSTPGPVSTGVNQTARPPTSDLKTQSSQISVASSNPQLTSPTISRLPPVSSTPASEVQTSSTTFRTLSLFFPNTTLEDASLARTMTWTTPVTPAPSSSSASILATESSQAPSSPTFNSAVSQTSPIWCVCHHRKPVGEVFFNVHLSRNIIHVRIAFCVSISKLSFIFFPILSPKYIYIKPTILAHRAIIDVVGNITYHPINIIFFNAHSDIILGIYFHPHDRVFVYLIYYRKQ
ncbi:hypothetical protein RB213_009424 [Colletotrichum asianum]